jgi:hypothetical protein
MDPPEQIDERDLLGHRRCSQCHRWAAHHSAHQRPHLQPWFRFFAERKPADARALISQAADLESRTSDQKSTRRLIRAVRGATGCVWMPFTPAAGSPGRRDA